MKKLPNKTGLIQRILILSLTLAGWQSNAQNVHDDKKELEKIIEVYSKSVIERDSISFYALFNDGPVTWCGALTERSQNRRVQELGAQKAGSNYFSGSYKGFMKGLFSHKTTEDKFDHIHIVQDGTVASCTMDYSFWADGKMTNWGKKYLMLIKKNGNWKITSVIYSLDLIAYFKKNDDSKSAKS